MRHGGKILIDQLRIQGVKRVFCIPGESYLAALDGLLESGIETIVGRHEGGVAMMAEAYGKLTGERLLRGGEGGMWLRRRELLELGDVGEAAGWEETGG